MPASDTEPTTSGRSPAAALEAIREGNWSSLTVTRLTLTPVFAVKSSAMIAAR